MKAETPILSARIESAGGPWEHVRVRGLEGREVISEPFTFDLDVACDLEHDLPQDAAPGAEISLVLEIDGVEVRRVHGMLGPIKSRLEPPDDHATYRLRLLPRMFRLTLVETQEIFLDRTVPEIIQDKLERNGFGSDDFELRLLETYESREFVVQYRESDLAFVSRLAEHHGISFFFEHGNDRDKLIFTDHPDGFRPVEGAEELSFRPRGEAVDVFALEVSTDLVPTSYIVQDYNYRTPKLDLTACHELDSGNGGGVVEYGAHVKTPEEAERIAKIRAEERRSRQRVYEGKSNRSSLSAGRKTTLVDHPRLPAQTPLLLVELLHEAKFPSFSDGDRAGEAFYHNTFRAIPADITYRPPLRTPKPRILGTTTGIIQPGPGGETEGIAKLDAEGRYTVEIHFDTKQPGEQKASHRIRMAQPFAGTNYGMHFPLRPGTEVLLAFTNGDPDRPIIVGALFNATSPSPVVDSNATKHQLKSPSGAIFEFGTRS